MPTYSEIPLIVQHFGNPIDFNPRSVKVELGKGGVVNRSRTNFLNATRKTYKIDAYVKDRDTVQDFLENNQGHPFEFRPDGINSAGLFICKEWSWSWLVYVGDKGVWKFSASFEQVFRPGWSTSFTGSGALQVAIPTLSGAGSFAVGAVTGSGTLQLPAVTVSGSGSIINVVTGTGALVTTPIQISGAGTVLNPYIGSGTLVTDAFGLSGSGTIIQLVTGSGTLQVPTISISGSGELIFTGSGSLETNPVEISGSGTEFTIEGSGNLIVPTVIVSGAGSIPDTDPNFADVSLLLPLDGANGSTTFTDTSSNGFTVIRLGSAVISTSQSVFGGASLHVPNTSPSTAGTDGLQVADNATFEFPGDFTIEVRIRISENPAASGWAIVTNYANSTTGWALQINASRQIALNLTGDGYDLQSSVAIPLNTWIYVAAKRSGSTVTLHQGTSGSTTQVASATNSTSIVGSNLTIGGLFVTGFGWYNHYKGYIDDLRITKGVARDVSQVPTGPFPTS
jgi:hypothetical protein